VAALPFSVVIPQFWLGAGGSDRADVTAAGNFQRLLLPRQPNVTLDLVRGGAHAMPTWRALVPPLLSWLTGRLAAADGNRPRPAPDPSGGGRPLAADRLWPDVLAAQAAARDNTEPCRGISFLPSSTSST
jgi:hypothetical protein